MSGSRGNHHPRTARPSGGALLICALACALLLAFAGGTAAAAEEETHFFDADLSLTGDCSTSALDPVPDPGCPGGSHPPSGPFSNPHAITTDFYGNIYVSSATLEDPDGGWIDVFDPNGNFLTELSLSYYPTSLAVDSEGNLYVANMANTPKIRRYPPSTYEPSKGKIEYGLPPVTVLEKTFSTIMAISLNRENDHIFANPGTAVYEYGSAVEGNPLIDESTGEMVEHSVGNGIAVDPVRKRIYASNVAFAGGPPIIRIFELEEPHEQIGVIDGSTTPAGKWLGGFLSIAVDEGTGHVFVYDGDGSSTPVHEFLPDGTYVAGIDHDFDWEIRLQIGIDNGPQSPNGGLNPDGRYLFVPSHTVGTGHAFAFEPKPGPQPPEVEDLSVTGVTEDDAVLRGNVSPNALETTYRFEYVTEEAFEEGGFEGATVAGEGTLAPSTETLPLTAAATGLAPGTSYRFRLVAESEAGAGDEEMAFATFPVRDVFGGCDNEARRTGPSAGLPDCRAYELVTPADTNGQPPFGGTTNPFFPTALANRAGDRLSFKVAGGAIPGFDVTGSHFGDPYLSAREEDGWRTASAGPTGTEIEEVLSGSSSRDQKYSFWKTGKQGGSAGIPGVEITYVRHPDGHSELVGQGSLGTIPNAQGRLISEGGGHVIFSTERDFPSQLEPNAPPDGTRTIYDRTADGVTHVVSLLPGDITPAANQHAFYGGASLDGKGIAFEFGDPLSGFKLYLRYENTETYEIGENVDFAGVAEGGNRIFYVEAGDLLRFDAQTEAVTAFSSSGDVTPVNVSADGSTAYFVSPSVLSGDPNPNGDLPQAGEENLYLSRAGAISFVGTVTERDVDGENANFDFGGLGLWSVGWSAGNLAVAPSRTTLGGDVLFFESRANLTGYDSGDRPQVYRYDAAGETLSCLSCSPIGAAATGEASLQSVSQGLGQPQPLNPATLVDGLWRGGERVFFESTEALVLADVDGLRDVYEWEDEGVGSCTTPGGCVYLISSGASARDDYLYAASESGDDVFVLTADQLVPWLDPDETPSIYDARVGGGFAPPPPLPGECLGETCQPAAQAPSDPPVLFRGQGNVPQETRPRCPKGKRKVRRAGKVRCVRPRKQRHHQKRGGRTRGDRRAHR